MKQGRFPQAENALFAYIRIGTGGRDREITGKRRFKMPEYMKMKGGSSYA